MKHVVVDLEMNPVARKFKEERKISCNEVIEIGAVALDENYNEISSFKTYVKPVLNDKIVKKCEVLTGIKFETVQDAPEFNKAFESFAKWCTDLNDELSFYEWSDNDYIQIVKEIKLKNYHVKEKEQIILKKWRDFQKEYVELVKFTRPVSLDNALNLAGIDFSGQMHDALFDARNTAELLAIVNDEEQFEKHLRTVIEVLSPSNIDTTIGEMFDLSKYNFDE